MQEAFNKIDILNFDIYNFENQKLDLSRIFFRLEIFENIFNFFLTGKLIIIDTQNIISNLPIIGNEKIKIILNHENNIMDLEFRIYKIERDYNNHKGIQKNQTFIFYLCSTENLFSTKISRKYNSKSEKIIQNLLTDNLKSEKKLFFEQTQNNIEVYSNFWGFQKIVEYILKLSKNEKYFDYVFFESLDGFNLMPVSSLLNQNSSESFIYDNNETAFLKNNNVKVFKFDKYFNILKDQVNGFFGKTQYQNHCTNYEYTKTQTNLFEIYDKIISLGKYIPFDENLLNYNEKIINNFYDVEISSVRTMILNLIQHYNLILKINGTLTRKTGQIIKFEYPKINDDELIQKSFDGKWIILGIHHIIDNGGGFDQNILISKNAKFDFENLKKINNINI